MRRGLIICAVLALAAAAAFWAFQKWQDNRLTSGLEDGLNKLAARTAHVEEDAAQLADERKEMTVSTNFPDAPDLVTEVARVILDGAVPTPDQIAALGDDLDRSWSMPFSADAPTFGHTLLREAVLARNFEATQALVAAGANARFNADEMAFLAVTYHTEGWRVWFPDYRPGMAFLNLWLEKGGSPAAVNNYYSSIGDLLHATPRDNLEAAMVLLQNGADGWLRHKPADADPDDTFVFDSYFEGLANANLMSCELIFRLAQAELLKPGPTDVVDAFFERYERVADQYRDASGPSDLATAWGLGRAMEAAYTNLGRTPNEAAQAVIDLTIPDDIGGFFLAPTEIRSDDDPDQRVNNDNQVGKEKWHDG